MNQFTTICMASLSVMALRAGGEGGIACGFPRLASRYFWPLLALRAGGEGGIRTHGSLRNFGFQDRRNRPLYHLSCSRFASAHY